MSAFVNWFIDRFSSEDIVDAKWILSDMIDIDLTPEERNEQAYYDAQATHANANHRGDDSGIPIGKRVR